MIFKQEMSISLGILKRFIYNAKSETFAKTSEKDFLPNQTSVLSYRDFDNSLFEGMIYTDMYNGNFIECGQEIVSLNLAAIWCNQYYGGIVAEYWDLSDKIKREMKKNFSMLQSDKLLYLTLVFLKQALLNMPLEFPVRGPKKHFANSVNFENQTYSGEWMYKNEWKKSSIFSCDDPFLSFVGEESIYYNGVEIYWHAYHGGIIRDKYFPALIND